MKWEEVKEGDLLQFRGTAPKKFKIKMIRKEFANRATLLFSEINTGEGYAMEVNLKENIADDITVIKQ